MVSCGSSSERADSLAADDAFDAAVDSQIQNAHNAAAADAAAVVFVRGRLTACGVIGPAATSDLRMVAEEVLGDGFTDLQWTVLHRMWKCGPLGVRRRPDSPLYLVFTGL